MDEMNNEKSIAPELSGSFPAPGIFEVGHSPYEVIPAADGPAPILPARPAVALPGGCHPAWRPPLACPPSPAGAVCPFETGRVMPFSSERPVLRPLETLNLTGFREIFPLFLADVLDASYI